MPNLVSIGQNSDGVFSISDQIPYANKNLHNSGTSDDIDMKSGPVTKLDVREI